MKDDNKNFIELIVSSCLVIPFYVAMALNTNNFWVEVILIILIFADLFYLVFKPFPRIIFEDLKEFKIIKNNNILYKCDNLTLSLVGYTLEWLFIVFAGLFINNFSFKKQYGMFFSLMM